MGRIAPRMRRCRRVIRGNGMDEEIAGKAMDIIDEAIGETEGELGYNK